MKKITSGMDSEADEIMNEFPQHGTFRAANDEPGNAYVFIDTERERLVIAPKTGGMLFISLGCVAGDLAPFCD